jgi:hypothetical protein
MASTARARCSTMSTAAPASASARTWPVSSSAATWGARLAVGSSSRNTAGSIISTLPMASIFRSPPLSRPARRVSIWPSRGNTPVTCSTRTLTSRLSSRYPPISRFSLTVSGAKTSSVCGT